MNEIHKGLFNNFVFYLFTYLLHEWELGGKICFLISFDVWGEVWYGYFYVRFSQWYCHFSEYIWFAVDASSSGDCDGGRRWVQEGAAARLPSVHGSSELREGTCVYTSLISVHYWSILTLKWLVHVDRKTRGETSSLHTFRAWWRKWYILLQLMLL